jgi:hypothetical protein
LPVVTGVIKRPPWTCRSSSFRNSPGLHLVFGKCGACGIDATVVLTVTHGRLDNQRGSTGLYRRHADLRHFRRIRPLFPRWVFLLCAMAGALSNLLTGLAGNESGMVAVLRFITGFLSGRYLPGGHENRRGVV